MKAKVKTAFPGRPDREILTRTIEVGEVIEGDLAAVAVREKLASEIKDGGEKKAAKPSDKVGEGGTEGEDQPAAGDSEGAQ